MGQRWQNARRKSGTLKMGVKTVNQFCSPGCVLSAKGLFSLVQCSLELARPLFFLLSMASGYSLAVCQQLPASHSNENIIAPK